MDLTTKVWLSELEEKLKRKKKQIEPKTSNLSPDDFEILGTTPTETREHRTQSDAEAFKHTQITSQVEAERDTRNLTLPVQSKTEQTVANSKIDDKPKVKQLPKPPRASKYKTTREKNPEQPISEVIKSEESQVQFENKEEEEKPNTRPRRNSDDGTWQKALQKTRFFIDTYSDKQPCKTPF